MKKLTAVLDEKSDFPHVITAADFQWTIDREKKYSASTPSHTTLCHDLLLAVHRIRTAEKIERYDFSIFDSVPLLYVTCRQNGTQSVVAIPGVEEYSP